MPSFLAMSFEGELVPELNLKCLDPNNPPADGWGVACYGRGEPSAYVIKEATPAQAVGRSTMLQRLEQVPSSIYLVQLRKARWGSSDSLANTQPFARAYGGRDWIFAHGGSMRHRLQTSGTRMFEPVGSTDSELIFCELLSRISDRKWRNLGYSDFALLRSWLAEFNQHGNMTCALSDGRDLVVYSDAEKPLYAWELKPPHGDLHFGDEELEVDLTHRGIKMRKGIVFSSDPLKPIGETVMSQRQIQPGTLVVLREGEVRLEVGPSPDETPKGNSTIVVRTRRQPRPKAADEKVMEVKHSTVYKYTTPVEHSTHLLRLAPIHDRMQEVLYHDMSVSVRGRQRDYEDVFGNQVKRLVIEAPFHEMSITSHSLVRVRDTDPLRFRPLHARSTVPLVWMPWQRQMISPYLLPPELPETQLIELVDYAMSFVRRNDYDLLETLIDMNNTIFREYEYVQGATNLFTTAYEVYERRRGVCQDFTNLFICMARLLGVPARYVCGYIYTGPKNPNHLQSEASHAWVQVYLPEAGWKGFDPTNGILTQTDHVRVAVGRNYVDATPTSGTIYAGGGGEHLTVDVFVEPVDEARIAELMGSQDSRQTELPLIDVSAPADPAPFIEQMPEPPPGLHAQAQQYQHTGPLPAERAAQSNTQMQVQQPGNNGGNTRNGNGNGNGSGFDPGDSS